MSSFTTITTSAVSAATSASETTFIEDGSHSDKIAIIGMTIGMVLLFLIFILPCICFQGLAHLQQKREEKKVAMEQAARDAGLGRVVAEQRSLNIYERDAVPGAQV
ncbi:uncharacterized protein FIESC28_02043 [Fusarium coffeatum]|uniref:Uncharacterized protein n=1 Tax=Fusarium coffeatum TaxID=231269 RepID=A0A366S938_9HYPO|nr:uncharacterized protein FIESC28_02043 [Fusarium coffeatum]RBR25135.1 hypothetical protein FIESC28_02043 [Fusarium coffeatum]